MDDIETLLTKLLMSDVIKCRGLTVGLARYIEIQEMLQKTTNIADATHFQKLFRKFYGMRFANAEWQQTFFQFMQERRYTPPSFIEAPWSIENCRHQAHPLGSHSADGTQRVAN
jgi:hypothetical protein